MRTLPLATLVLMLALLGTACAPAAKPGSARINEPPAGRVSQARAQQELQRLTALADAEPWSARPVASDEARALVRGSFAWQLPQAPLRLELTLLRAILDIQPPLPTRPAADVVEQLWNAHPELRRLDSLALAEREYLPSVALWRYILLSTGDAAYLAMAGELQPLVARAARLRGYARHFHALTLLQEGRYAQVCQLLRGDSSPKAAVLKSSAFVLGRLPAVASAGVGNVDAVVLRMVLLGRSGSLDLEPFRFLLIRSGPEPYATMEHPGFCSLRREPWFAALALDNPVLLAPLAGCESLGVDEAGAIAAQWLQLTYGTGSKLHWRQERMRGAGGRAAAIVKELCRASGPKLLETEPAGDADAVLVHREALAGGERLVLTGSRRLKLRLDLR